MGQSGDKEEIKKEIKEQIIKEEINLRIYESALSLFREKGIKFTMDDIAKNLGISKKTVYQNIQDKETLLNEMVDYGFDLIKAAERKIVESEMPLLDKIQQIIIVLPEQYQNLDLRQMIQIKDRYPKIYQKVTVRLETGWEETLRLLQEAMDQGLIRNLNVVILKAILEGAFEHFLGSSVLPDNQIQYETALQTMMDIMMNGIKR